MEFFLYLTPEAKEIINLVMRANYQVTQNSTFCRNNQIVGYIKNKSLSICLTNIKNSVSPVSYYVNETIYHEGVHIAQHCRGSALNIQTNLDQAQQQSVSRSLKASNSSKTYEAEAYELEDKPEEVIKYIKRYCF